MIDYEEVFTQGRLVETTIFDETYFGRVDGLSDEDEVFIEVLLHKTGDLDWQDKIAFIIAPASRVNVVSDEVGALRLLEVDR